ncbi:MAG TPA: hypothetical protein EYN71_01010 [Flavobacteriales bacterium]|nr:hypothetical protein [Flavobacteriales bacterium]HIO67499.1 hypothetical protein [Flavobacteriales bacterium]
MGPNHLLEFYRDLQGDNLSFIYKGQFSDSITDKLIELSEFNINNTEEVRKLRNKVSFIMVESFQNIVRHGGENTDVGQRGEHPSTFLVRNQGNAFYITSVNVIENREVATLKEKLDKVNTLAPEDLKQLFNQVLASNSFTDKGGAGLGLIEMVRKSGETIDYDFKEVTPGKSYCFMRMKLKQVDDTNLDFAPFSVDKELHSRFIDEDILMLYKGNFSQKSVVPVLQMMEENMHDMIDELTLQKKTFNVLVEVLQNISKHGGINNKGKKMGMFIIGESGDGFVVSAGNLIKNDEVASLREQLSNLAGQDAGGLSQLYKKYLREGHRSEAGAGLGLIDIYRDSESRVEFDFSPVNETQSFYSIAITV